LDGKIPPDPAERRRPAARATRMEQKELKKSLTIQWFAELVNDERWIISCVEIEIIHTGFCDKAFCPNKL
jgi:hypothetical protein